MEKSNKEKTFSVLGEEFSVKHYPVLYRWAERNLDTLEERLQNLADVIYSGDVVSAAQALESDLEHGS